MVIIKIVIIIVAVFIGLAARKQLLKDIKELEGLDFQVLRKASDILSKEHENCTVAKVILPSPKIVREKLVECLETLLRKLKEY